MHILSEENIKKIANQKIAFDAVEQAFIAAYQQKGNIFPVVHGRGCDEGNTFSVKSGNLTDLRISGLKTGSYWAGNHLKGIPNHGTTTILLDEGTGFARAVLNAGYLNGLRTAAANAVASNSLARNDASTLGVLGAGHQAIFEIKAICAIRHIKKVLIHSRNEKTVSKAMMELASSGIFAEYADSETVCRQADILVTVTGAREALFDAAWIKPGTHISAMGADQPGKRELPVELVLKSSLFADYPPQSRVNGEFEAAYGENPDLDITAIGAVLVGEHDGRTDDDQITIFDSSGIALQDLCVATAVLDIAIEQGLAQEVDF
ncbi:MAG: ornithine cyclodeaminase family protein [Kordiimonadaceae bacterium]|jgi:ornithine cyclodeaminase|nr:ornithine cyclodeaminase family protein [Kordiimonadaceae bacterium]MBT6032816.1 ornithine cyclodeaminase family protein [Kordiimonadaceae bacterium]MBT6330368.1 ornithine cyclodeaminase family protein [Kordiimonadaceae bacterium]MBT7583851.1 ornithine cyclodeaminase family protein [Kordiimonadaceae bacterium]